ncbi:phosphotransferase family protein [Halalkalicoccus tibetensis]|uniref:Phosphotransferase family protein n=1 Tax=Halalkalicoccus tibetensis TaxID=175632 RepID=A0ABD5V841_9EURY
MDDIPEAREISESTLEEMLQTVNPAWELRDATPAEGGFCSTYQIILSSNNTTRDLYVKASPDGQTYSIPTEARLQATLNTQTTIPVPKVHGITDDHETLPTPYFIMEALAGEAVAYERIGQLEDEALRRLARELGEYLAELHSIPVLENFGHVRHNGPALTGDRPSGDPGILTVNDPYIDWPTCLQAYATRELDRHAESRFAELTPQLRHWVEASIENLQGPFEPVLGRNDHGLHNLLIDPATGEITAMLDWGYTLAVPATFDFEFAVYLFSGAFLAGLPDVSDRRSLVREAMLEGYRTVAPDRANVLVTPEPLYEALAMTRVMNDFHHLDIPEESEPTVRARISNDLRVLLG